MNHTATILGWQNFARRSLFLLAAPTRSFGTPPALATIKVSRVSKAQFQSSLQRQETRIQQLLESSHRNQAQYLRTLSSHGLRMRSSNPKRGAKPQSSWYPCTVLREGYAIQPRPCRSPSTPSTCAYWLESSGCTASRQSTESTLVGYKCTKDLSALQSV